MATDAILETIKPRRSEELPVTTAPGNRKAVGLRRRVPSFSVSIRSSEALMRRAPSASGALRRWWERGLDWVMARRPPFARGLGMSGDEAAALGGCHNRGTWRHVLYKVRAGARRLLGRDGRPRVAEQDFGYDSVSYARNFDDGDAA
jgi:hypothetical protein